MQYFRTSKFVKILTIFMAYLLLNSCMGTYYNVITPKQMQLQTPGEEWREGRECRLIQNDSLKAAVAFNSVYKNYLVANIDFTNNSKSNILLDPASCYLQTGRIDSLGNQQICNTFSEPISDISLAGAPAEEVRIPTPPDKKSEEIMQTVCLIIGIVTVVAVVIYIVSSSSDSKKDDKKKGDHDGNNNHHHNHESNSSGSCFGSSNNNNSNSTVVVVNNNEEELRQIRANQEKLLAATETNNHTSSLLNNALLKNTVKPGETINGKVYFKAPTSAGATEQAVKLFLPLISQQQSVDFKLLYDVKTEKR